MTVETRNPLPAGRYWIDVSKEPTQLGTFLGFLDAAKGFVHVEATEDDPDFSWYLFTTTKDLVWPSNIGYPTIAEKNVKSRADTVQRLDPEKDVLDQIPSASDIAGNVTGALTQALTLVAAVVAAAIGLRILAKRK